jgi:hypothetical protein
MRASRSSERNSPPEQQEEWPRHEEEEAKPPFRSGRGGVVKQFLATPPRLRELEVASQLFLNRASAQTFKASPQFGQLCLATSTGFTSLSFRFCDFDAEQR